MNKIFTIGFTKKSAEIFFSKLSDAGVRRVVDVRLNNSSQLAGFAKQNDLCYFLKTICGIDYAHIPELAPTKEMLDEFKRNKGDWSVYETKYFTLLAERKIDDKILNTIKDKDCLLCSEDKPDFCHRRLAAEYISRLFGDMEMAHII